MKQSTLLAFIGGAVAGAVAALLLAPDSGANTRKKIREKAEEEYEILKEKINKRNGCNTSSVEDKAE
ncbi:MAG: YtxH domain-containing protein [Bacteroidales bacterium]